jgi:uncharacterized repeat protein (TIGR01451 family)
MKQASILRTIAMAVCAALATPALVGQNNNNSILLFGPVYVRLSTTNTGNGDAQTIFNSQTVQLSCAAGTPISAVLSSTADGTGNVITDNFINLTLTAGDSGPVNLCQGGVFYAGYYSCFTPYLENLGGSGLITGMDPDNYTALGGIPPIDISNYLQTGSQQVKFDMVDTGGYLSASTLYLDTSCSQAGVSGPEQITGNPISSTNPTPQQLTQSFPFDSTSSQIIDFVYDLAPAFNAGGLSIINQTTPNVADQPIDPATWIPVWVPGTSFATSSCLTHTGELLPSGAPACKLYTLECNIGTDPSESGGQCPISQTPNEVFQEIFDGPTFTLPDIVNANGPTFHQGVGFLMASEGWTGGQCQFDQTTDFAALLCPQNLLTSFTGPGVYTSTSHGTHPNSSFITVAPVPEDLTSVTVAGQQPGGWINSDTANVTFSSQPPTFAGVQPPPPGAQNFLPSPITSITYGISLASNVPTPGNPVPGDTTLTNSIACPTSSNPTEPAATTFTPPQQMITVPDGDGMYLVHYFARDCASTEELHFTQDSGGSWSTSFYTVPINVDTTAPTVVTGPTLSPPPSTNYGVPNSYVLNQANVKVSYSCTDSLSGVVSCGTSTFPVGTLNTGTITNSINTSTAGTYTFTVNAKDAAGNAASPVSVSYTVVAPPPPPPPPVDLALVKLAPLAVSHNAVFVYDISAANFGGNAASSVVVTDTLPAGVTYQGTSAQLFTCGAKGCSYSTTAVKCSYASNTVTCNLASLGVTNWFNIAELNIEINVKATGAAGTTVSNTATITSADPDQHPGDNHSTAVTRITK